MSHLKMDPWGRPYGGIKLNGDPCFLVKSPCEYWYMRVLRFFLRTVSGWPGQELGEKLLPFEGKFYSRYISSLCVIVIILQAWYVVDNFSRLTFFELGHMYVAMLMTVLSSSRGFTLCISEKYRTLASKFLTQTHVFFHKDKSDYARLVYKKVHRLSTIFSVYLVAITTTAFILFNVMPPYINYAKGKFNGTNDPVNVTFELSVYFKLPFDPERNFRSYCYSLIMNLYGTYLSATSVIMFDLFLSIMVFNLWGHFNILLHSLDTFPRPAALDANDITDFNRQAIMYSRQEQVEVSSKLEECIVYHRSIVDFTNEMSNCFGIVLFVYYTFHQVSGCLMLLECSQGPEALARYLPLTIMMTAQLIQISVTFETVGSMSEKLKDGVYCLPWEFMNTKNRTTVMIFLINVQEPVHIKAGGLVDVGVTTMAGILKASFSYFTFFRTRDFD